MINYAILVLVNTNYLINQYQLLFLMLESHEAPIFSG